MLSLLTALSPNAAVLILTAGIALIALELNRPSSILPGAIGLLLALLAAARLSRFHPDRDAVLVILGMSLMLLSQFGWKLHWIIVCTITVVLILAIHWLLPGGSPRISLWIAVPCGVAFAAGTTILTRIARRARQNKGLD